MGAKSRRKGKSGELEVRAMAREEGFATAQRGAPMQAQGGEVLADVCEVGRLWIESKRYKRTPVNRFAREVLAEERVGYVAVLAYRDDHQPEPFAVVKLRDLLRLERAARGAGPVNGWDAVEQAELRQPDTAGKDPGEPA